MDLENHKSMIRNLLPQGLAWPRHRDTNLDLFLEALAGEPYRVDSRVVDMLREAYPLTTAELITDWERALGLPEECEGLASTLQARREAVYFKLSLIGGQSPGYYIDVAARLGYEITITEFHPFRVGEDTAGEPVYGEDWAYAWQVNAETDTITYFKVGQGTAGDPLAAWGNELLECVISRLKPAHTIVIFAYTLAPAGADFDPADFDPADFDTE